jgi:Glycosyl transferase family 2
MNKPTISVALCTYNGERFLREQLESIAAQTQLPDEIVVCDDCSSDRTLAIVREFSGRVTFQVFIHENKQPLGTTKNFEKAALHCTGDLIFFCDQDDYWFPQKIERLTAFMEQDPTLEMAFADAILVDEKRQSFDKYQLNMVRLYPRQRQQWRSGQAVDLLLEGNRVAGCTTVVKRSFAQHLMPYPTHIPTLIHDGWLALVAAVLGKIDFTEEVLGEYRQHSNQQIGSLTTKNGPPVTLDQRFNRHREEKLGPLRDKKEFFDQLYHQVQGVVPPQSPALEKFRRKIDHLSSRSTLPTPRLRRLIGIGKEWSKGNYQKYVDQDARWYGSFLTALGDLVE